MPVSHRWLAAAALAVLTVLTAGCASFNAALGKQEAVVQFQPQTTSRAILQVRSACSHVQSAKPEPLPTHMTAVAAGYEVRYLVTGASDANLARLQQCLGRFKSVAGIEFISPDGG